MLAGHQVPQRVGREVVKELEGRGFGRPAVVEPRHAGSGELPHHGLLLGAADLAEPVQFGGDGRGLLGVESAEQLRPLLVAAGIAAGRRLCGGLRLELPWRVVSAQE